MASNPYLQSQANDIATNMTQNWQQNALPSINSGAMQAGGFGGSRQGVAQGISANGLNQAIGQAQTGLYSNAYNTDQNIAAQQAMQQAQLAAQERMNNANLGLGYTQAGNNFTLGLGNLGLGYTQAGNNYNLGLGQLGLQDKSLDINNFNTNRQLDLSQYGLGANLANQANLGLSSQGQQLYQNGQQQQQAPYQSLSQYANLLSPFTGLNNSRTDTTPGASTIGSAAGGAITAAQLWQLLSGLNKQPGG